MGDDGSEGALLLHQAHGLVLVQDEQSSIVYGMPREAMLRNAADQVLSLEQIADLLTRFIPQNVIDYYRNGGILHTVLRKMLK